MKAAWNFQIIYQKLNLTRFEEMENYSENRKQLEEEKESLRRQLNALKFSTEGQVFCGKDEKLLSLQELAVIKKFHKEKFHSEFSFFSQFSHSTAFANHFIKSSGISLSLIAATYDRIVPYFVGIVTESIELLLPGHTELEYLQMRYKEIIANRWNIYNSE